MFRAGLVLLTTIIALGLAELVLRAIVRRAAAAASHRYMTADPVLHHRARAGVSTIVAGTPFSTSSLGLRDREYASPKPPSTFRNLMLGDPNQALLGSVDQDVIEPDGSDHAKTYLRIVAKPNSIYNELKLPIQVAERK